MEYEASEGRDGERSMVPGDHHRIGESVFRSTDRIFTRVHVAGRSVRGHEQDSHVVGSHRETAAHMGGRQCLHLRKLRSRWQTRRYW